jgi:hypothetical protein
LSRRIFDFWQFLDTKKYRMPYYNSETGKDWGPVEDLVWHMTELYKRDPKAYLKILLPPERLGIRHDVTEVRDTGNFLGPPPPPRPVAPPPKFLDSDDTDDEWLHGPPPAPPPRPPPQTNFLSGSDEIESGSSSSSSESIERQSSSSSISDDPIENPPPQNFLDSDDDEEDPVPTAQPPARPVLRSLCQPRLAPTGQAPNPPRPAAPYPTTPAAQSGRQPGRVEKDLHGDYYLKVNNKWQLLGKTIPDGWVVSKPEKRPPPQQFPKRPPNQPGRCEYWDGLYWVRNPQSDSWKSVGRHLPNGWLVSAHSSKNPPNERRRRGG